MKVAVGARYSSRGIAPREGYTNRASSVLLDSLASRETAFLLNNLLFVAFTFTVLLGTMYPLIAEAFRGVKVSVGAPYFNQSSCTISCSLDLNRAATLSSPRFRSSNALNRLSKTIFPN